MKNIVFTICLLAQAFSTYDVNNFQTNFTEKEILHQLDLAQKGIPSEYYPVGRKQDIKYNFPLDLEHGYYYFAGSKIHLYADAKRWAIVFETSSYANRGTRAEIDLTYIGNCINYPVDKYPDRNYITNVNTIEIISPEEYERIKNKTGPEKEQFELIDPNAKFVTVKGQQIAIEHDNKKYTRLGIKIRDYDNPRHLIGFEDLVRYIYETQPQKLNATAADIMAHLPHDLPKIMTIDKFHFESVYNKANLPETQETYQLIAKILVARNPSLWKPTVKPNNHWSNWDSGNL